MKLDGLVPGVLLILVQASFTIAHGDHTTPVPVTHVLASSNATGTVAYDAGTTGNDEKGTKKADEKAVGLSVAIERQIEKAVNDHAKPGAAAYHHVPEKTGLPVLPTGVEPLVCVHMKVCKDCKPGPDHATTYQVRTIDDSDTSGMDRCVPRPAETCANGVVIPAHECPPAPSPTETPTPWGGLSYGLSGLSGGGEGGDDGRYSPGDPRSGMIPAKPSGDVKLEVMGITGLVALIGFVAFVIL